MLVDSNLLYQDQEYVCKETVESIIKGIKLGDKIPEIKIVDIFEARAFLNDDSFMAEVPEGYLIYNGNHRAAAYRQLSLEVPSDSSNLGRWIDFDFWEPLDNLIIFSNTSIHEEKKKHGFYR